MEAKSLVSDKVLTMLKEGLYPAQIARTLNCSRPNISKIIKKLKAGGQLTEKKRLTLFKEYIVNPKEQVNTSKTRLTPLGKVNTNPKDKVNSSHWVNKQKPARLHALALKQQIQALSTEQIEKKLEDAGYQANLQGEQGYHYSKEANTIFYFLALNGLNARLTTKSLTIWAKERYSTQEALAIKQMHTQAFAELKLLLLKGKGLFNLDFIGEPQIIEEHIAFMDDPGAALAIEQKQKILIKDRKDGKARIEVDKSKGEPEVEPVHKDHALADSLKYAQMVEEVCVDNAWIELRLTLSNQVMFNDGILKRLDKLQETLEKLKAK